MGSSSSQSTTLNETIDVVTQNMVSITQSAAQNAGAVVASSQVINIDNEGTMECSLSATNTQNVNVNLKAMSESTFGTNTAALISQALDQAAKSGQASVQGFLSTPLASSSQDSNTNISTSLKSLISTSVVQKTTQDCLAQFDGSQTINFVNHGIIRGSSCNFGNNLAATLCATCIMQGVSDAVSNNSTVLSDVQAAAATQDAKQQGTNDLVDSIGKAISSIFSGPALIIGIILIGGIVLLVVIALIIKSGSGSGRQSRKKAA